MMGHEGARDGTCWISRASPRLAQVRFLCHSLSRLSRVTSRLDSCVAMVGTWPAGPVAVIAWGQRSQYEGDSDPYRFIEEWAHMPRSNRYHTVWYEARRGPLQCGTARWMVWIQPAGRQSSAKQAFLACNGGSSTTLRGSSCAGPKSLHRGAEIRASKDQQRNGESTSGRPRGGRPHPPALHPRGREGVSAQPGCAPGCLGWRDAGGHRVGGSQVRAPAC